MEIDPHTYFFSFARLFRWFSVLSAITLTDPHNADSFAFIYTGLETSISEISASIPKIDEFSSVQLKA